MIKLKVFFSWQMETDLQGIKTKGFLIECINSAINEINNKGQLKGVELELFEGLNHTSGNPRVSEEMFKQIDECDIFVGDFTIVQRICKRGERLLNKHCVFFRRSPNCNVYGEYNRALGKREDFWKQIILLMNDVNGKPNEDDNIIPFDTRERRWPITFNLEDNSEDSKDAAKKKLMTVLPEALRMSAIAAIESIERRFYPFVSWSAQRKDNRMNFSIVSDDDVKTYKNLIVQNKRVLCIMGPKTYGKAILVNKAYSGSDDVNCYLYCNADDNEHDKIKDKIVMIFEKHQKLTMVVDNCDVTLFNFILNLKEKHGTNNRCIAILNDKDIRGVDHDNFDTLDLSTFFKESASDLLENVGIDSLGRLAITSFCQEDPSLIKVIADNYLLHQNKDVALTDERIVTILTGYEVNSTERLVLQSLALFEYIGWKNERQVDLSFILSNKNITSIDKDAMTLRNTAVGIIKQGVKVGYIENVGRTSSITLKPLVKQLLKEWLLSVDVERLKSVIDCLENGEHDWLIKQFRNRFIWLSDDEEAKTIIRELFEVGGKFEDPKVLDSKDGSLFIETFANICPDCVVDMLFRVFNAQSIEQRKAFEDGRRNIVWTLSHLCYISETFEKAAETLLLLAVAENENFSNNATGNFVSLFPVHLPSTCVSLKRRLNFLQEKMKVAVYKPIVMKALRRAVLFRDFLLFKDSVAYGQHEHVCYKPQTDEEICNYISECLKLVKNEILSDSDKNNFGIGIIEEAVGALCVKGKAKLVLPVIKEIGAKLNYKWDKMLHLLLLFRKKVKVVLTDEELNSYDSLIKELTSNDLVSRFVRIEKECYYSEQNLSIEEQLQQQKEAYKTLAEEICEKKLLTYEVLEKFVCADVIVNRVFGKSLALLMDEEEQLRFIHDYVEICNKHQNAKIGMLADFVSEVKYTVFEKSIEVLTNCKPSYTIFACMACQNILPQDGLFSILQSLVEKGKAKVDDFLKYWSYMHFDLMTSDFYLKLFTAIIQYDGGYETIIHMASAAINRDKGIDKNSDIAKFLVSIYMEKYGENVPISQDYRQENLLMALLKNGDQKDLAYRVNHQVLAAASESDIYFSNQNGFDELYRLLMNKYFDVIWAPLSETLLENNVDLKFNLKMFLGKRFADENSPIIMEGEHFPIMLKWCDAHPDTAPAILASMIPIANDERFTDEAKELIDRFADRPHVLDNIKNSLISFSWIGSVVPYYKNLEKIYATLLNHENDKVKQWAQQEVNQCKYNIQEATKQETEEFL